MKNRLFVIGAGGHGKVVADIALNLGYTDIAFIDDNAKGEVMGIPVAGSCELLTELNDGKSDFVIAVGNNNTRKLIAERYDLNYVSLVHPRAAVAKSAALGEGSVVMAGAVINPCAKVGKHCIVNTCADVEHDCVLEDFVHVSPGVMLGGTVNVGECTHVGIGASVKNNIDICGGCTVGAGGVVVNNITEKSVYIGVPAKKWKSGGGVKLSSFIPLNTEHTPIRRCAV